MAATITPSRRRASEQASGQLCRSPPFSRRGPFSYYDQTSSLPRPTQLRPPQASLSIALPAYLAQLSLLPPKTRLCVLASLSPSLPIISLWSVTHSLPGPLYFFVARARASVFPVIALSLLIPQLPSFIILGCSAEPSNFSFICCSFAKCDTSPPRLGSMHTRTNVCDGRGKGVPQKTTLVQMGAL